MTKTIGLVLDGKDLIKVPYNLEVSSPGMNRPLVKLEHFRRFVGKTAKIVVLEDGGNTRTRIGEIICAEEDTVTLSVEGEEGLDDSLWLDTLEAEDPLETVLLELLMENELGDDTDD